MSDGGVWLITGAGSGMGAALARAALDAGADAGCCRIGLVHAAVSAVA